jgi:hypothetical protein
VSDCFFTLSSSSGVRFSSPGKSTIEEEKHDDQAKREVNDVCSHVCFAFFPFAKPPRESQQEESKTQTIHNWFSNSLCRLFRATQHRRHRFTLSAL